MTDVPDARSIEFQKAVTLSSVATGEYVLDFPSGGGYLRRYLPGGACYIAAETVPDYSRYADMLVCDWDRIPLADGSIDVVISIAALHHLTDRRENVYREVCQLLRSGGRFVIADVAAGSAPADWLDHFVDRYSSQGHVASFLEAEEECARLTTAGLHVASYEVQHYPWLFSSRRQMIDFCRGLFRLDKASDDCIQQGLHDYLGVNETQDGGVELNWSLALSRAEKITA